ncbi:MMPL family transporter [Frankia sp. AgKG'84/4]
MPLFTESASQRESRTDQATYATLPRGSEDRTGPPARVSAEAVATAEGSPPAPPRVMASLASMAGVPAPRRSLFTVAADVAVLHRGRLLAAACLVVMVLLPWDAGIYHQLATGGFYAKSDRSTQAEQLLDDEFPDAPPNVAVMLTAEGGINGPTPVHLGRELTRQLTAESGVSSVMSYWPDGAGAGNTLLRSQDGRSALIVFRLTGSEDHIQHRLEELHSRYSHLGQGVRVRFGGAPAVMQDVTERSRKDLEFGEMAAAPLVFLVLLYSFGTIAAAMLPILVGVVSVVTSLALLRVAATVTDISVFSVNLTTALGFGLAVDYSLFILRRFREEQQRGMFPGAALRRTLETAGRTVAFSGVTVALSLTAALAFPLYYLRSFAFAGIIVVITSEAAALLVLPAALMVLGPKLDRGDVRAALSRRLGRSAAAGAPRHASANRAPRAVAPGRRWTALARQVMRRPVLFGGAAIVLLLVCAAPARNLHLALADDTVLPAAAEAHTVNDAMRGDFALCLPCQIPVVMPGVDARDPSNAAKISDYARRLSGLTGVLRVDTVTGGYMDGKQVSTAPTTPTGFVGTHGGAWLSIWQNATSPVSADAKNLVRRIEATKAPFGILMGGLAPHFLDTSHTILRSLPLAFTVVMVMTFVLLFLFTGSLLLPLKAMLLNTLNLAATIGLLTFIFQSGHLRGIVGDFQVSGTLEMTSPVLMFFIAFGLSMDYEIFLLARVREEYKRTGDNTESVAVGLGVTGPLITSVALALVVVMVVLSASHISMIKMVGVGLTIAITLDVTIVRAILVPAFMSLAGDYNWWAPAPLRRLHDRFGLREAEDDAPAAGPQPMAEFRPPAGRPERDGVRAGRGRLGIGGAAYGLPAGVAMNVGAAQPPATRRPQPLALDAAPARPAPRASADPSYRPTVPLRGQAGRPRRQPAKQVTIGDPTMGGHRDQVTRPTTKIRYRRARGDAGAGRVPSPTRTPTWHYFVRGRRRTDPLGRPVVTGTRGFVVDRLGSGRPVVIDGEVHG